MAYLPGAVLPHSPWMDTNGVGAMPELGHVYDLIVRRLVRGKVVPVLGAGVNLSERPPQVSWELGRYLPSGQELAARLATYIGNVPIDSYDLARVSQYLAALEGEGSLYDELHDVFDADYPPTYFHRFLARLARRTREAEDVRECMLIVTTNYDDSLERAFVDEGEPYDLLTYIGVGTDREFFRHIPFEVEPSVIRKPNEYTDLPLDRRTVIAEIHGAVDRLNRADNFVITEDDYVDEVAALSEPRPHRAPGPRRGSRARGAWLPAAAAWARPRRAGRWSAGS
jgi:hypothetical protein